MKTHGKFREETVQREWPGREKGGAVGGKLFVPAWLFIFLAAGYDSYFAWQYREVLLEWELNPLALWAARRYGLPAVFAFKFAVLSLAGALAWYCSSRHRHLEQLLTLVIGGAYGLLSLHYVVSHHQSAADESLFGSRAALRAPAR